MNNRYSIIFISAILLSLAAVLSYFFLDQKVFTWLCHYFNGWHKPIWLKPLEQFGKAWLLIWLLLSWVLITGRQRPACIGCLALLLLVVTILPLKITIQRQRPRDILSGNSQAESKKVIIGSWSFPSGDTASVFAVVTAIAPILSWIWVALLFVAGGGVGFLRVMSFAHYPSDVFAGAAIGVLTGHLAFQLNPFLSSRKIDLNRWIALVGVITIPATIALSEGLKNLFVFLFFYLPLVIIIYLLSIIRKKAIIK